MWDLESSRKSLPAYLTRREVISFTMLAWMKHSRMFNPWQTLWFTWMSDRFMMEQ